MTGLPKKYAKMGFKKGWKAFKGKKGSLRLGGKRKMAKRRSYTKRAKAKSRSVGKVSMAGVKKIAIGVAGVIAYELFLSPMIPLTSMTKNILEMLVGIVLLVSPKMPPVLRAVGGAMATINLFQLATPVVAGWFNGGGNAEPVY